MIRLFINICCIISLCIDRCKCHSIFTMGVNINHFTIFTLESILPRHNSLINIKLKSELKVNSNQYEKLAITVFNMEMFFFLLNINPKLDTKVSTTIVDMTQYRFNITCWHVHVAPNITCWHMHIAPNITCWHVHLAPNITCWQVHKGKGKVFYGQEPPSGESTTTECGVNYQLLAVITEAAQWGTPSCRNIRRIERLIFSV